MIAPTKENTRREDEGLRTNRRHGSALGMWRAQVTVNHPLRLWGFDSLRSHVNEIHDFMVQYDMLREYARGLREGWRRGQSFFNAIPDAAMADTLRGTLYDPFYKDTQEALMGAILFLRTKGY